MARSLRLILFIILTLVLGTGAQKAQALDAKTKTFLVMCAYGTVGGALLGFATMAYGTSSRAIAQGASIGLYTGIAFGTYVVLTHDSKSEAEYDEEENAAPAYGNPPPGPYYNPPQDGSYAPANDGYGGGSYGNPNDRQYFKPALRLQELNELEGSWQHKKGTFSQVPIRIQLIDYRF